MPKKSTNKTKTNGKANGHADPALDALCAKITAKWRRAIEDWIDIGKMLLQAKGKPGARGQLEHGDFLPWVARMQAEKKLPFGPRTAQELMRIANNSVLSNTSNWSHLPCCYRTLATLARAPEGELQEWIEKRCVDPDTQPQDVRRLLGWQDRDKAIDALNVLLRILPYVPVKELVGYWCTRERPTVIKGMVSEPMPPHENIVGELRDLAAYFTELQAELQTRYEAENGRIHFRPSPFGRQKKRRAQGDEMDEERRNG
jgi:hypothetical protein